MDAPEENLPQTVTAWVHLINEIQEETCSYIQLILWTSEAGEHADKIKALETKFWKIQRATKLTWGKTNTVYKIETEKWTFVLKTGIWLEREKEFFWANTDTSLIPKMYDFSEFWEKQCIIMEYKSWENGKDVCDKIENWEEVGQQMWKVLREIHSKTSQINETSKTKSTDDVINYLSWWNTKEDLSELRKILDENNNGIVNLHGDFSPHNCLFSAKESWNYEIAAILDPSGRISQWPAIFDVFYALNWRWIRDKPSFQKWFLAWYGEVNLESGEYKILSKVFSQYLKTLYNWMDTQETK